MPGLAKQSGRQRKVARNVKLRRAVGSHAILLSSLKEARNCLVPAATTLSLMS